MALGVCDGEFAAAVGRVLKWTDDGCVSGDGASVNGIGIGNNDVDAARFNTAEVGRRLEAPAMFIVFLGAEHDHASADGELGMADGSGWAFMNCVALETDDVAEPVNCGGRIAITHSGDYSAVNFRHGEPPGCRRQISAESESLQEGRGRGEMVGEWGMLRGMELPARDRELVQIVDAALADAARRAGAWLQCRVGCTQCCYGAFAISALDAARVRAGMEELRVTNPELAAEIERRSRDWIAEHAAEFPGDAVTGVLGETEDDQARFEEFANQAACPALDEATGRCDVYAWRPMTCRVFGPPIRMGAGMDGGEGLGHCELCFVGASEEEVAACEMPVPHELEAELLDEISAKSETVVAFALLG